MKKILIMMFLSLMSINILGVPYDDPFKQSGFDFNTEADFAKYYTEITESKYHEPETTVFTAESDGNPGITTPIQQNRFSSAVIEKSDNKFYLGDGDVYGDLETPISNVDKAGRIKRIINTIDCSLNELDELIEIEAKKTLLMTPDFKISNDEGACGVFGGYDTCELSLNEYLINLTKIRALKHKIYTRITTPFEISILDWITTQRMERAIWNKLDLNEISQITDRGQRVQRLKYDADKIWNEGIKWDFFNPKTGELNTTYMSYQKRIDAAGRAYDYAIYKSSPQNTAAIIIETPSDSNQNNCHPDCTGECIWDYNAGGHQCHCSETETGFDEDHNGTVDYCINDYKCNIKCAQTNGTCNSFIYNNIERAKCDFCPNGTYPKDINFDGYADMCEKYLSCPSNSFPIDTDGDGYADICDDADGCDNVYNEFGEKCNGGGVCHSKVCYCYDGYKAKNNTCYGHYLNLLGTRLTDNEYENGSNEDEGRYFATDIWPGQKGYEWFERYVVALNARNFFNKVRKGDVLNIRGKDNLLKVLISPFRGFYHHTSMAAKDLELEKGEIIDPYDKAFISSRTDGVMYEPRRMYQYLYYKDLSEGEGYFYTPQYYIITVQTPEETMIGWKSKWKKFSFFWGWIRIPIPIPFFYTERPSQEQRDKAVDFADRMLGRPYYIWVIEHLIPFYQYNMDEFYCSSLVWRAWDKVEDAWFWGFDIDSTLNPTVFPVNTVDDWNMGPKKVLIYRNLLPKAFTACDLDGDNNTSGLCEEYFSDLPYLLDVSRKHITSAESEYMGDWE